MESARTLSEVMEFFKTKFNGFLTVDREKTSADCKVVCLYREMFGQIVYFVLAHMGAKFGWVLVSVYRAGDKLNIFSSKQFFAAKPPFFIQFRLEMFRGDLMLAVHGDSEDRDFPVRHVFPVAEMIPLSSEEKRPQRELLFLGKEFVLGGKSIQEMLRLKREYAESTGQKWITTPLEKRLVEVHREEAKAAFRIKQDEKEAERLRREAEREERKKAFTGRDTVSAYTFEGKRHYGVPITPAEYNRHDHHVLDHGAFVMVVDIDGAPLKTFRLVKRSGGRVEEANSCENLRKEKPRRPDEKTTAVAIDAPVILVKAGESWKPASVLSREQRDAFRKKGMNGGTVFVLAGEYTKGSLKAQVYEFQGTNIATVGLCEARD